MLAKINTEKIRRFTLFLAMLVFTFTFSVSQVTANTVDELQAEKERLQVEIQQGEEKIEELAVRIDTLEGKIAQLNSEISLATREIELTEVKLEELEARLVKAEAELDRQKGLLRAALRALYARRGASTVELLIASDSFSDFINEQEYLERLQGAVKESAEKVIELRQQIKEEQGEQQFLLSQQQQQRGILNDKKAQQQTLLEKTGGEEAQYRELVRDRLNELEEAELALAAALASGSFKAVPVGPVLGGDVVGEIGNSGLSTGPHLHLEVRVGGSVTNPNPFIKYPPVNFPEISQGYGVRDPIYISGFHPGIDYPGQGNIYAIDSGYMYRGCSNDILNTSNNAYGYVAIVEHTAGHFSVYAHMAGGPDACSYNTW
jgi:septal ring factor EnvC (AmiA/AmiB activator)